MRSRSRRAPGSSRPRTVAHKPLCRASRCAPRSRAGRRARRGARRWRRARSRGCAYRKKTSWPCRAASAACRRRRPLLSCVLALRSPAQVLRATPVQRPVLLLLLLSAGLNRAKRAVHGTYAQEQIVVQSHVCNQKRITRSASCSAQRKFASSSCAQCAASPRARAPAAEAMFALRRSTTRCVALLQVAAALSRGRRRRPSGPRLPPKVLRRPEGGVPAVARCHPELYDELLKEKVATLEASLRSATSYAPLPAIEVHESQREHFRMRAAFQVWHVGDEPDCTRHLVMYERDNRDPHEDRSISRWGREKSTSSCLS